MGTTTDSDGFLYLLQVTSASFPSGAFSHSTGFETLVAGGGIESADDLRPLIEVWLKLGLMPLEGTATALAHSAFDGEDADRSVSGLQELDDLVGALKAPRETYEASTMVGRAFLRVVDDAFGDAFGGNVVRALKAAIDRGQLAGHAPVVFGLCAAAAGVSRRTAVLAHLHGAVANVVGVVGRLVPLGQFEIQRLIADTRLDLERATDLALIRQIEEIAGMTAFLDVASMGHERLTTRLCIS